MTTQPTTGSLRSALFTGALYAFVPGILGGPGEVAAQAFPDNVTIRNYFKAGTDSLTFNRPVAVKPYPAEDSAFVILEQGGRILTVRWVTNAWQITDTASITVLNGTSGIDEQGLLGFAFHPDYRQNRKYYVFYVGGTSNARLHFLAERIAGTSLRPASGDPHRTVMRIPNPYDNHNGGTLGFDMEGYLVLATGDGGTIQGDPQNRAQNTDSLLGKFLRIDVDAPDAYPQDTTRNYAIPSTNPFLDSAGVRPEIWAYGLRNPWKWAFHPVTGDIWVGDVGQNTWEEISRVPKGANLGWRLREGPACFNPSTNCPSEGLQEPALSLQRSHASSVTGGVFFMGDPASTYHGAYVFGDYGTHHVWAARLGEDGRLTDSTRIGSVNKVVSFDRDHQGRILATSISPSTGFGITSNVGRVFVLESPDMALAPVTAVQAGRRHPAGAPIHAMDVRRAPGNYALRGLDGRATRDLSRGVTIVTQKNTAGERGTRTAVIATVD